MPPFWHGFGEHGSPGKRLTVRYIAHNQFMGARRNFPREDKIACEIVREFATETPHNVTISNSRGGGGAPGAYEPTLTVVGTQSTDTCTW